MALLFTHLMMLITKYMHNGASSISVMQDIAGLLLLVSMECAFEVMLLLVLVRQNNLPMLSSAYEKGVLRCSFLVQACIAIAYISNSHPYTWVLMLRTTDPDKWGDTTPLDICPNHSNAHPAPSWAVSGPIVLHWCRPSNYPSRLSSFFGGGIGTFVGRMWQNQLKAMRRERINEEKESEERRRQADQRRRDSSRRQMRRRRKRK
ncbi:unnamed protein product [Vitrella brassicaformis CCMP3155]|uniref:Uncharacterized protein n=1 Tax=Vitrella brassicaformis (strain CCMP3155) TaxID=1169540 RepID=A0A0G4ECH3_VITBC|nr:unnamed protein product [Vitrella brassicaformis CCMP3155]|eukprot:CEL93661.1 unnamed protein product [Vitrella brassicaformis CCMP3155]